MTETTAVAVRQPTMVLSDVSKSYAGVAALTDVSLEVLPGEVHALLGENGAGKSTLMGVASGTIQPDAGVAHARRRAARLAEPGGRHAAPASPSSTSTRRCCPT